ncbi:MAG TPA: glycosyltransferase family 2 protein, partial [Solirubrobacteraceae bacterium]|nr:glycosyltransferase family 2 protein [Solirubrobacteraceae bacterium]
MDAQTQLMDVVDERPLKLLSVVAPVYNEVALIEAFYQRVCSALEGISFELVLVDDGSSDGSLEVLEQLAATDPRVRVVILSRNFGHQLALTAGLDHAVGDAVVMLDADLQDPPELILQMLEHWRSGCDVVYA